MLELAIRVNLNRLFEILNLLFGLVIDLLALDVLELKEYIIGEHLGLSVLVQAVLAANSTNEARKESCNFFNYKHRHEGTNSYTIKYSMNLSESI